MKIQITKTARACVSGLLFLWFLGCASVQVDTTDTAEFKAGNYKTYSWMGAPIDNSAGSTDPLYVLDPALRSAVDTKLASKGYRYVKTGGDFVIDYQFKDTLVAGSLNSTAAEADNLYPAPSNQAVINRRPDQALVDNAYALSGPKELNSILIRFSDGETLNMVWAAGVSKVVDKLYFDSDDLQKTIQVAVDRALGRLPSAS